MHKQSEDDLHAIALCESPHGFWNVSLFIMSPSRTTLWQVFDADGAALFPDSHGSSSVLEYLR